MGQVDLVCETQEKLHTLKFQLLSKEVIGSQPPLLSGSYCVKLGLKGSVPLPVPSVPKESAEKVCQLDSEVQEKSLSPPQRLLGGGGGG